MVDEIDLNLDHFPILLNFEVNDVFHAPLIHKVHSDNIKVNDRLLRRLPGIRMSLVNMFTDEKFKDLDGLSDSIRMLCYKKPRAQENKQK